LGEPDTPDVVAVTVTVAVRAAPVFAPAVIVKLPGVLPDAADTVSHVWFEATVYAITLVVALLVTLIALLVAPAATGAQVVELMAKVGVVEPPEAVRITSSI